MSTVNLTIRAKTPEGRRFLPVAFAANGRVKPGWAVREGNEERVGAGTYYLDWNAGGRRERLSVGTDAASALNRKLRKEAELKAVAQGIALAPEDVEKTSTNLQAAVAEYLEEIKLTRKPKTFSAYTTALTYFLESCRKTNVEDIDRKDLMRFTVHMRDELELSARTVYNKFEAVMSFLKVHKMTSVATKRDWPRYTEEQPEVYEREELDALRKLCRGEESIWWEFFLKTGMREQEVIFCSWADVNFNSGTVSVRHKPVYGWTPKMYKEREIPVPDSLLATLEPIRKKTGLVFHTESGLPKRDFLHCLKYIARRGKLLEDSYYLHKFRATFATWHLQGGPEGSGKPVDLRTVQEWMGHTDLESTMRYLRPARHSQVRDRVNSTFG